MSFRDSQFGELKVPLTWTAAVALIVAAVVAVALLLTDRREAFRPETYGEARSTADRVLAPVGSALSAPVRWTGAGVEAVGGYFFAVSENRRLKAELREMRQWRDVALALKNENGRFRSLLGLKTDPPIPMVAARVVSDARGPFADTRVANAGVEAGVAAGNPVLSEYGLVGRVIGVTKGASRVLMLTDAASRTPVMIDRTNARAILSGDGGPNPRLDYLRGQDPVREGDRVLSSGDGGLMPRGLPVGYAVKGLDGRWRVALSSDKGPIDFVRVLLFQDFTQTVDQHQLDRLPTPPPTPGAASVTVPPSAPPTAGQTAAPKPAAVTLSPKPQPTKPEAAKSEAAKPAPSSPAAKPAASKPAAVTVSPKPQSTKPEAAKSEATKPAPSSPAAKPAASKPAAAAAKPATKQTTGTKPHAPPKARPASPPAAEEPPV